MIMETPKQLKLKKLWIFSKKSLKKNLKKKIKYTFNSNIKNINTINLNKNVKSFDTKDNSYNIIKKYYSLKIKLYEK